MLYCVVELKCTVSDLLNYKKCQFFQINPGVIACYLRSL